MMILTKQFLFILLIFTFNNNYFSTTHVVSNINDSGVGSLRNKISLAAEGDTISFSPSLISLGSDTIKLDTQIDIEKGLVLKGLFNNVDTLYISGQDSSTVFEIDLANALIKYAMIDSLSIINGKGNFGSLIIRNFDSVFIYNSFLQNNKKSALSISNFNESKVEIFNTSFDSNKAIYEGGAILCYVFNEFELNINKSTLINNSAAHGSGIYISNTKRLKINLESTTLSNNYSLASQGWGAGMFISSDSTCHLNIINSTISNNVSSFHSGIYKTPNSSGNIITNIKNSTIAHNPLKLGQNMADGDTIFIESSILLLPHPVSTHPIISSKGYNILKGFNLIDIPQPHATDQLIYDSLLVKLGPLQDNGNNTLTHMPGDFSIALNNGNPNDNSLAQNGSVYGIREVGSAENSCSSTSTSASFTVNECSAYTPPSGNLSYTSSQQIIDTIRNRCGADSVMFINLNIYNITSTDTEIACDSYTWINGVAYTTSNNSDTHTLISQTGCDSVVTLDLTILNSSAPSIDEISSCQPITWIDGNTYTSSNNTAFYTLQNVLGCDSVINLNYTLLNPSSSIDYRSECNSLLWIDGVTYTENNNTATFTTLNSNGCDSVITLNLIISPHDLSITLNSNELSSNATGNVFYQWLDCNNNYTELPYGYNRVYNVIENGSYAVEISNQYCTDTSNCMTVSNVNMDIKEVINIEAPFPNPMKDYIIIKNLNYNIRSILVRNALGQKIRELNTNYIREIKLDFSKEEDGIYFIDIKTSKTKEVFKVLKIE
jgi:hypothetical protein